VDLLAPETKEGVRRVPVKTGIGDGTRIELLDGVAEGDKVVQPS
jgi:hypothetical protein